MATANQPEQSAPKEELTGWKEIAEHIGVSERTARNWERDRSLPVRRRGSAAVALVSELELWKSESLSPAAAGTPSKTAAPMSPARTLPRGLLFSIAGGVIGMMLAAVGFAIHRSTEFPKGPPAGLRFQDKTLFVHNAKGDELWRYTFPDPVHPEEYFPYNLPKRSWIGDIDGDGNPEVLFIYNSVSNLVTGTPLYCFSESGKVKWIYSAGRQILLGNKVLNAVYFSTLKVLPERQQIIVRSNHSMTSPQQISLVNGNGKPVAEYWHNGHLIDFTVSDLNGSGDLNILMTGISNPDHRATLVVLPLKSFPPAIETEGPADLNTLAGRGGERAIVLFPRSCFNQKLDPFNRGFHVTEKDGKIDVTVFESYTEANSGPPLIYTFDKDFRLVDLLISSGFEAKHKQLEAEGKLDHAFSKAEIDQLKRGVVVKRP